MIPLILAALIALLKNQKEKVNSNSDFEKASVERPSEGNCG